MKNIAIIGAGGFGREVKTIIDAVNKKGKQYNFIGFFDDGFEKGTIINGFPILGKIKDIADIMEPIALVIAIGNPKTKQKIKENITNKLVNYPNIIHPNTSISDDFVILGMGNIICEACILTCNINIGNFVILNLGCTVGHDTNIGNYSSAMPSVNISGEVQLFDNVYIGTGAKIINQVTIGRDTTIGAGAVIIKDIPDYAVVVGNPGKIIKYNKEN